MGNGECGDLGQQRPNLQGKEKQAQNKQYVVQTLGHDVFVPQGQVTHECRTAGLGSTALSRQRRADLARGKQAGKGVIARPFVAQDQRPKAAPRTNFDRR